jgi:hypothetical protein
MNSVGSEIMEVVEEGPPVAEEEEEEMAEHMKVALVEAGENVSFYGYFERLSASN